MTTLFLFNVIQIIQQLKMIAFLITKKFSLNYRTAFIDNNIDFI